MYQKSSKYRNVRTEVDGIRFDSKLEARIYTHLKLLQKAGQVKYFLRQVPIHLPGGVTMRIDFMIIWNRDPDFVDAKGKATRDWLNKRKIAEAIYPITIRTVGSEKDLPKVELLGKD